MAVTRLFTPRPYDSFDPAIAGVSPILATGTDVDNTKLTAVQAAAVAAGLGTLPTSAGGTAPTPVAEPLRFRGAWQASTVYSYGDVVINAGVQYVAPTSFTSGGSFVSANWTRLGTYDGTDPGLNAAYVSAFNVAGYGAKGDGSTNDTAALQAALDAANTAGGGRVFVPGGTYLIATALQIGSNTHLELDPHATIKRNAAIDNMLRNKSDGTTGGYGQVTNVTVTGGTWDANQANFASTVTGITFGHGSNVNISRTTIKNIFGWHFIELNAIQNGVVRDCTFLDMDGATTGKEAVQIDGAFDSGAFPWFGPYDNTTCADILIQGCYFSNVDRAIGSHAMAGNLSHTRIQVIGNRINGAREEGVYAYAWDHAVISGNTINGALRGVMLADVGDVTRFGYAITNNVIGGFAAGGDAANARGIWVAPTVNTKTYKRGVIAGNVVDGTNARHSLTVDNAAEWVIADNVVFGQTRSGIIGFESSNLTIKGNRCLTGASGSAIVIGSSSNAANDSILVSDNQADTVNAVAAQKLMIRGNVISTSLTVAGGITDSHSLQNYVAGVYVAGS